MDLTEIANYRLINQQIGGAKFKTAKEIVAWMGAIQAQDYAMAKWAIGVRIPGSTDGLIETAIDNGEVLRTHLLRPTWHFVSAEAIHWMLALTAPRIKGGDEFQAEAIRAYGRHFDEEQYHIGKRGERRQAFDA